MAIIIVAPEVGVGLAVREFQDAYASLQRAKNHERNKELSLTHAFYANMRGFAAEVQVATTQESITVASTVPITMSSSSKVEPKNSVSESTDAEKALALSNTPQDLRALDLTEYGECFFPHSVEG
jgi:hypothetical protein